MLYCRLNGYALVIQDNQNLQQLWNLDDGRNMTILDKMMFHFNPKLCLDLIAELHKKARPPGSPDYLETDVSPWSNGDKTTCNEKVLLHRLLTVYLPSTYRLLTVYLTST